MEYSYNRCIVFSTNSVILCHLWFGLDCLTFLFNMAHFLLLCCLSGNFLLDVGHCEFFFIGSWMYMYLYFSTYSWALLWGVIQLLAITLILLGPVRRARTVFSMGSSFAHDPGKTQMNTRCPANRGRCAPRWPVRIGQWESNPFLGFSFGSFLTHMCTLSKYLRRTVSRVWSFLWDSPLPSMLSYRYPVQHLGFPKLSAPPQLGFL